MGAFFLEGPSERRYFCALHYPVLNFLSWNVSPGAVSCRHHVQPLKHRQTCGTCVAQMVWTCIGNTKYLRHIQFVVLVKLNSRAHAQKPRPRLIYCECAHHVQCCGHFQCQICDTCTVETICSHDEENLGLLNTWKTWLTYTVLEDKLLTKFLAGEGHIWGNSTQVPLLAPLKNKVGYHLTSSLHIILNMNEKSISYFCTHLFHRGVAFLRSQRTTKTHAFCPDIKKKKKKAAELPSHKTTEES